MIFRKKNSVAPGNQILKKNQTNHSFLKQWFQIENKYRKSDGHASFVTILFLVTAIRIKVKVKDKIIK